MLIHRPVMRILGLLLAAVFLTGCAQAAPPPGAHTMSGSFDNALYSYHKWDAGLAVLIWHDFSYGESGCRGTSSSEDPVYRLTCEVDSRDGRSFDWEITTEDGAAGRMWINGESYSLAEGAVFLVSSPAGETQTRQLPRDLTGLDSENNMIVSWSVRDPEIGAFLEGTAAGVVPGESLTDEEAARAALITFFDHLQAGNYAAAVDLYGGSYEIMVSHNPTLDPSDLAALWRAACTENGAQCLRVAGAHLQKGPQAPEGEYEFLVVFLQEDGTNFTRGPCCGEDPSEVVEQQAFPFRVRKVAEYYFQVLTSPVYLP